MLARSKRLTSSLFSKTLKEGIVFNTNYFIFYILRGQKSFRISVSVPKKVAKMAVQRNKIRRRIYSIIELFELRVLSLWNVVIVVKCGSDKLPFKILEEEIHRAFVKCEILR